MLLLFLQIFTYKQLKKQCSNLEHKKIAKIPVENQPVFNMRKGFRLVDYEKEYADKRNIEEVLNIFNNPDNVQIPNLMMILNHI